MQSAFPSQRTGRTDPDVPEIVLQTKQRLAEQPPAEQVPLLAILARELMLTAGTIGRHLSREDSTVPRALLWRMQVFVGFQLRINRALLGAQLQSRPADPRLAEVIYRIASWFGFGSEVLRSYARFLRAPAHAGEECPCCGYFTLSQRGGFDRCSVCFWQDDEATEFFGEVVPDRPPGPNRVALGQARENFDEVGAAEERFLASRFSHWRRPPREEERPRS